MIGQIPYSGHVLWTFLFHALMYFPKSKKSKIVAFQTLIKILELSLIKFLVETWLVGRMRKVRFLFLLRHFSMRFLFFYLLQLFFQYKVCRMHDSSFFLSFLIGNVSSEMATFFFFRHWCSWVWKPSQQRDFLFNARRNPLGWGSCPWHWFL